MNAVISHYESIRKLYIAYMVIINDVSYMRLLDTIMQYTGGLRILLRVINTVLVLLALLHILIIHACSLSQI